MGILGRAAPSGRLQSQNLYPYVQGGDGYRVARALFFGPLPTALPYIVRYDTTLVPTVALTQVVDFPRTPTGVTRLRGVGRLRSAHLIRELPASHSAHLANADFFGSFVPSFTLTVETAPYDGRCTVIYTADPLAMAPPYDTVLTNPNAFGYEPTPFPLVILRPVPYETSGSGGANVGYAG